MKALLLFLMIPYVFAVNVQQFQRSNTLTYEMLEDARVKNSHVFNDYDMAFTLGASYVNEPLTVKDLANTKQFRAPIKDMLSVHLGVSAYIFNNVMLGASTFYSKFKDDLGESRSGLGDTNLNLTWRFLLKDRFAMALMPFVTLPTGSSGADSQINIGTSTSPSFQTMNPISDDELAYGGMFIYEHFFNFMNFVVNVGYKKSPGAAFQEIDLRERLMTGIGAYIPISQKWGINAEYMRHWGLPISDNQNPNELYLGTSFGIARRIAGFAGVGLGNIFSDSDGNDFRVSAGLKFTPRIWSEKREAIKPIRIKKRKVVKEYNVQNIIDLEADDGIDLRLSECDENGVFNETNTYIVRFPHDVGVIISPEQLTYITESINARMNDIEKVLVTGHTSAPGSAPYNMSLSKKRAISVSQLLVSKGIPKGLVFYRGKGETMLLDSSGSSEAEEINRRVEIKAILKGQAKSCE